MKIDAYNQISQIYGANSKLKTYECSKVSSSDKVEISGLGKDIQAVTRGLKNIPDIREDKVEQIKADISNGTYHISDESFAQKLLEAYDQNV